MGQKANLILIDGEPDYKLFYCHWCANTIPTDIFWGPEFTHAYIERQRRVEVKDWLDEIWAEGGLVFDVISKTIVFYGGEDLLLEIPLRRLYLDLLREVWAGWTIRWAHQGIVDMADYVGFPRQVVLKSEKPGKIEAITFLPDDPQHRDWTDTILSIVFQDGTLRLFRLMDVAPIPFLMVGPVLTEAAQKAGGLATLSSQPQQFPYSGLHIDTVAKQVAVWSAREIGALVERVSPFWPGWEIVWLEDNFEYQLSRTANQLGLPLPSENELLVLLETILMHEAKHMDVVDTIHKIAEVTNTKAEKIQINPFALRNDPQNVTQVVRRQILDQAIAGWRSKRP